MKSAALVTLSAALLLSCASPPTPPASEVSEPDARAVTVTPLAPSPYDGVCYEIFVRSFADSDGNGIGDLKGLTAKLDYVNDGDPGKPGDLGADCVWLMPVAASPSYHGYDVTDYYRVNPDYGTNDDFRAFVNAAHARGIRVLVDFVANHTSSKHPWFQAAAKDKSSPYRDYYRWSPTKLDDKAPWGADAWHESPEGGEYYYALFWGGMPDLNYDNPKVLEEMEKAAAFWLNDLGADGLRVDAVPHLVEENGLVAHAPRTHDVLRAFESSLKKAAPSAFTIGEVWTEDVSVVEPYYPDQLDDYFAFGVAGGLVDAARSGDATKLLYALREANDDLPAGRWAPFLTNHDMPRVMTELGDVAKAKVAASALLTLPGLPFVYYGEELGMVGTKPDEKIRTPMPWNGEDGGGFTTGKPWEDFQVGWKTANVAAESAEPGSLLNHYRRWIALRMAHPALRHGELTILSSGRDAVAAYLRKASEETLLVVVNFGGEDAEGVKLDVAGSLEALEGEGTDPSSLRVPARTASVYRVQGP